MVTPPPQSHRSRTILLLALVLAAGLALRLWYLGSLPGPDRFYDERFTLENVQALRESGSLRPANGYYPLLSYLPQALVFAASDRLGALTGAAELATRDGDGFSEHAYRLARTVETLWGLAALGLTFLVGRRLFSDEVGLAAAAALAFSPWHVHASGVFKPDAQLVTLALLALLATLAAEERPTAARWALAGAAVALAMSSKLTGGLTALPLVAAAAARARREPRRLLLLALAGAVALALFLALNPYPRALIAGLESNAFLYAFRAGREQLTRADAPALLGSFVFRSFGLVGALVAAAAAVALAARLLLRRPGGRQGLAEALLLGFPLLWAAGMVAATAQYKHNNFLPILPPLAVVLAWGLAGALRRLPAGRGVALAALVLALFAPRGVLYVYRSLTPTAADRAERFVERRLAGRKHCLALRERGPDPWPPWEGRRGLGGCAVVAVGDIGELDAEALAGADGLVFPSRRLRGALADLYAEARRDRPRRARPFEPRRFEIRGPAAVGMVGSWRLAAPPLPLALTVADGSVEAALPAELAPGETVSFRLWLPAAALGAGGEPPRLELGGEAVELVRLYRRRRRVVYLSWRWRVSGEADRARLEADRLAWEGRELVLELLRWR